MKNEKVNVYLTGPYNINSASIAKYPFDNEGNPHSIENIGTTDFGSNVLGILTIGCTYPSIREDKEIDILDKQGKVAIPVIENKALEVFKNKFGTYEEFLNLDNKEFKEATSYGMSLISGLLFHNMMYFEYDEDNGKKSVAGILGSTLSKIVSGYFKDSIISKDNCSFLFAMDPESAFGSKTFKTYYNKETLSKYFNLNETPTDMMCLVKPIFAKYDEDKVYIKKALISFCDRNLNEVIVTLLGFTKDVDNNNGNKVTEMTLL